MSTMIRSGAGVAPALPAPSAATTRQAWTPSRDPDGDGCGVRPGTRRAGERLPRAGGRAVAGRVDLGGARARAAEVVGDGPVQARAASRRGGRREPARRGRRAVEVDHAVGHRPAGAVAVDLDRHPVDAVADAVERELDGVVADAGRPGPAHVARDRRPAGGRCRRCRSCRPALQSTRAAFAPPAIQPGVRWRRTDGGRRDVAHEHPRVVDEVAAGVLGARLHLGRASGGRCTGRRAGRRGRRARPPATGACRRRPRSRGPGGRP